MEDVEELIEKMQNGDYDPQYNNRHYLSYEMEHAAKNVKRLAQTLHEKETYKQGLRFAKMGLYLAIFEDTHAKKFFDRALQILHKLETKKSKKLIDYLTNYDIDQPIDLKGRKYDEKFKTYFGAKWHKETFEKTVQDFNKLRKHAWRILFNNKQFFAQDMDKCFQSVQNTIKNRLEKYDYKLIEIKDEYQINKNKLNKRLEKYEKSMERKVEEKFLQDYQKNELIKLAKLSPEECRKLPEDKKDLVTKLRKHYQEIKDKIQNQEASTKEEIMEEKEELETEYIDKIKELKKNCIESNNVKETFFKEMEDDKLASYFGKDILRIFGVYGLDFDTEELWKKFIDLEFKNEGIQDSYERLVEKLQNKQNKFQNKREEFLEKIEQYLNDI